MSQIVIKHATLSDVPEVASIEDICDSEHGGAAWRKMCLSF